MNNSSMTALAEQELRARLDPTIENYLDLSLAYYQTGRYEDCIAAACEVLKFQSGNAVAHNNIAASHLALGQWDLAIAAGNEALRFRPEYQLAKNNLRAAKSEKAKIAVAAYIQHPHKPVIAIHRPGAIGDILMTLNSIPALKDANPSREIWYFCHGWFAKPEQLGNIILTAGCDRVLDCDIVDVWTPIFERMIVPSGYPLNEGYPHKPMSDHLVNYFTREMGLESAASQLPSLRLPRPQRLNDMPKDYATLQWKASWSSYKEWPFERWEALVNELDFPVVIMSPANTPRLSDAIALVANARMHIGIDSFANHLTNFTWVDDDAIIGRKLPAVILWGSTQVSAAGYPHNTNISLGLECQPCFREDPTRTLHVQLGPCINPPGQTYDHPQHSCMYGISEEQVLREVRDMWERTRTLEVV